jgi:hypothetical protein
MKIVLSAAFAAICAFAQTAGTPDIPRLLAERGITSAMEFATAYEAFQNAVGAIPAAIADMDQAITCTKRAVRMTAACEDSDFGFAVKHFQAARFNLRRSHSRADDALSAMILEIIGRSFETGNGNKFVVSDEEAIAARRYLKAARESIDHDFPPAERQWQKTWWRAEKVIGHHRTKSAQARSRRERA